MLSLLNIIIWILAILLSVALLTLLERKLLASLQRRVGPDTVGIFGILQPIADAVKLVTKQTSSTANSQRFIFYVAPAYALILVIFCWAIIASLFLSTTTTQLNLDYSYDNLNIITSTINLVLLYLPNTYQWLVILAILSLTIYSQLLLGWAANSAYAFLGSLRSSAALISYELILSTAALVPMLMSQSYSFDAIILNQSQIKYALPLLPVFIIFLISSLAEASRVPFDLVEAESELVSGYYTEHASVAFTLLFLAEYASILLFSTINAIFWFGTTNYIYLSVGIAAMLSFVILARALLPRMRYDRLISVCWTALLPIIFALIVAIPILMYTLQAY